MGGLGQLDEDLEGLSPRRTAVRPRWLWPSTCLALHGPSAEDPGAGATLDRAYLVAPSVEHSSSLHGTVLAADHQVDGLAGAELGATAHNGVERDVDRARNVTLGVLSRLAHINDDLPVLHCVGKVVNAHLANHRHSLAIRSASPTAVQAATSVWQRSDLAAARIEDAVAYLACRAATIVNLTEHRPDRTEHR